MMNATSIHRVTALCLISTLLWGCGTTSAIKPTAQTGSAEATSALNLAAFNAVTVLNFHDGTENREATEATTQFADLIAAQLQQAQAFAAVHRTPASEESVVVTGEITRYAKGNAALRMLVGLGAGRTHFDAMVRISDGHEGNILGVIDVDRKSWPLGGAVAAGQSVDYFMRKAAEKIANELTSAKLGRQKQPSEE